MTETKWSLLNLVSEEDADELIAGLRADDFALRVFDATGAVDKGGLIAQLAATFEFSPGGWDSVADDLWNRLTPDDDEDEVAVVWRHADVPLEHDLASFLELVDILKTIGRRAYSSEMVVLIFLLGTGPNFPALASRGRG